MPMNTERNRPNIEVAASPEILDDLDVLTGGQLADQERGSDHEQRERHEVVEHLVSNRLAEHADRDRGRRPHEASRDGVSRPRRVRSTSGAVTLWTKTSSSVSRIGLSEARWAPAAVSSLRSCSGGGSSASSRV